MAIDAVTNGFGISSADLYPKGNTKASTQTESAVHVDPSVSVAQAAIVTQSAVASTTDTSNNTQNDNKDDKRSSSDNSSNDYSKKVQKEQQTKEQRVKEEQEKQREDEQRKADIKKLTEELNSKMNQFGSSIKFGINDKADSIAVSVMSSGGETNIKSISSQDATKLADRMSYVLGILFDRKA